MTFSGGYSPTRDALVAVLLVSIDGNGAPRPLEQLVESVSGARLWSRQQIERAVDGLVRSGHASLIVRDDGRVLVTREAEPRFGGVA